MRSKLEGREQMADGRTPLVGDSSGFVGMSIQLFSHLPRSVKNNIRTATVLSVLLLTSFYSIAQGGADSAMKMRPAEMATTMRSNGKIYVVVAVLIIILSGLFFYLIRLDRKITRLEKGDNS